MLKELIKLFIRTNGRNPNKLELLQLKFKAAQQSGKGEVIEFPPSAITDWRKPRPTTGKKGEVIDTSFASGVDRSGKRITMSNADYGSLKDEWFGRIIANTEDDINTFLKRGIDAADERFKNLTPKQRKDFLDMVDYRLKHGNEKFIDNFTDAKGEFKLPEDLAGGGLAGMLGEPTYQDDNHRVPYSGGGSDPLAGGRSQIMSGQVLPLDFDELDPDELLHIIKLIQAGEIPNLADGGRIGFSEGKGPKMSRRGFLKAAAGLASIPFFGKFFKWAKPLAKTSKAAEVIKSAKSGTTPPPYFFKLVDKIKAMGDDVTKKFATQERQKVTQYKDFELTENLTTGEKTIQKSRSADPDIGGPANMSEEVYMSYRPGEKIIGKNKKPTKTKPEYTEDTSLIRGDGPNTGEIYDTFDGVPDDVIQEVTKVIKKAEGGRVPFSKGKRVLEGLAKLFDEFFPETTKIGKTSKPMAEKTQLRKAIADFQERQKNKIIDHSGDAPKAGEGRFTKAEAVIMRLENTIKGSKGKKDKESKYVLETFPNFIKEIKAKPELANNKNVWDNLMGDLPKDQQFVVYGDDTVDFFTQSKFGPHNIASKKAFHKKHPYLTEEEAVKISSMEPNDQVMELKRLQTLRTTKHADGGRVPMWLGGGLGAGKGLLRAIMKHHAETGTTGLKGSEMLKLVNPKQFNKMLDSPEGIPAIAKEMIEKYTKEMKADRVGAVEHSLGLAKKMKTAKDKSKEMDKITEALTKDFVNRGMDKEMVEGLIEMFLKSKYPDYQKVKTIKALPNVTDEAILELENIQKNLATKDRKLNASGGLAGMLGE